MNHTEKLKGYINELKEELKKSLINKYGEENEKSIGCDIDIQTIPIRNTSAFHYDRSAHQFDTEIEIILTEINKKYFSEEG
jgi:hypothetical protein